MIENRLPDPCPRGDRLQPELGIEGRGEMPQIGRHVLPGCRSHLLPAGAMVMAVARHL